MTAANERGAALLDAIEAYAEARFRHGQLVEASEGRAALEEAEADVAAARREVRALLGLAEPDEGADGDTGEDAADDAELAALIAEVGEPDPDNFDRQDDLRELRDRRAALMAR